MTMKAIKAVKQELRELRVEWKAWRDGRNLHWGMPWCVDGAAGRCDEPTCEGCGTVAYVRERMDEVAVKGEHLAATLPL